MKLLRQTFVYAWIFIFNTVMLATPAQATLIGVDAIHATQSRPDAEQKIQTALARDELSGTLQRLGVRPHDVKDRIAALSDDEVSTLAQRIDSLPAGGDFFATVGIILVILLVTDLLGFTKVFPFTRSQR